MAIPEGKCWRAVVASALIERRIREPLEPSELAYAFGLRLHPRLAQRRPIVLANRLYYPPAPVAEVLRFVSEAIAERILALAGHTLSVALVSSAARCLREADAGLNARASGEWSIDGGPKLRDLPEAAEEGKERSLSEMRLRRPEQV